MARRGGGHGGHGGNSGLFRDVERWLTARLRHPRYQHRHVGHVNPHAPGGPRGTGFHHRFGGQNPPGARVRVDPNTGREMILEHGYHGTYRARVDVQDAAGNWHPKRGSSTFFPDNWTPQTVDETVNDAFRRRDPHPTDPDKWRGSANGLTVDGFFDSSGHGWYSAWPVI
jgi:hypothetical protein